MRLIATLFFFASALLVAGTSGPKDLYAIKLTRVAPGVLCAIGDFDPPNRKNLGFVSNVCAIDLGESLLIVDAGPTYRFAEEFVRKLEARVAKPIRALVLSNYHDDRILGASYFAQRQIPIVAQRSLLDDLRDHPEKFRRLRALLTPEEYAHTRLVAPDFLFERHMTIRGTRRSVELLKLSPVSEERSDLVVWVPDLKFLFAGNIVFNDRMLNYTKNSDIDGWIKALEGIAALHPKLVLGGHGSLRGPRGYETTLRYLRTLKKQVDAAYRQDVDLAELMDHLDLSSFDGLLHAKELDRHNAGNYYRQLEWR